MMKIKCLIVDDEELALDVIEKHISHIPTLKLVGRCDNAIEAISFLHENKVDLLFLDLNMPELNGLDLLKTLNNPPKVILTTAYSEYALESYEFGVVDYLLKPIKLERFIKAVNKAVELFTLKEGNINKIPDYQEHKILIKEDQTSYNLSAGEINFIEAYGNYLKVHTEEKVYLVRDTMQHMSDSLSSNLFVRIHKRFIANLSKIRKIKGNMLYLKDIELPIGNTYKRDVLARIQ